MTYQLVDRWLGRDLVDPVVEGLVKRYLRAFGPASAADMTTWSGVTGLGPVLAGIGQLVRHHDEAGRVLYDVADAELVEEDVPAPVRLLGRFDNVWLAHAGRDRVAPREHRERWQQGYHGRPSAVLADGYLDALWQVEDGGVRVVETLRRLTRAELAEESDRVEQLLAR